MADGGARAEASRADGRPQGAARADGGRAQGPMEGRSSLHANVRDLGGVPG
eukprot:CAMPEP_0195085504 /NCGR_PEP_ID=MMETSP0448-20130528/25898_1 /TAXON_ID=66468 /ORGANISM="Heterocapsa triquestra, Strain CCMP 448" /LENGTH=50 /DNA_ID=CAMNT_0040118903 /DNA_START=64 /DNA_END=216 /DNA_ORIENTATION=+